MSAAAAPQRAAFGEAARLAWPVTLSLLLHAGYRVNDQYWIRALGAEAQAALGVTTFMLILNFAFISVVTTGALVSSAKARNSTEACALITPPPT